MDFDVETQRKERILELRKDVRGWRIFGLVSASIACVATTVALIFALSSSECEARKTSVDELFGSFPEPPAETPNQESDRKFMDFTLPDLKAD